MAGMVGWRKGALFFLLGLALSACGVFGSSPQPSSGNTAGSTPGQSFNEFSDMPIPSGAKIDLDKTLVLGAAGAWSGRLVLDTSQSAAELYDFFLRQMQQYGWTEITAVRATISVLVYQSGGRIATLTLVNNMLSGGTVDITVSPSQKQSSSN